MGVSWAGLMEELEGHLSKKGGRTVKQLQKDLKWWKKEDIKKGLEKLDKSGRAKPDKNGVWSLPTKVRIEVPNGEENPLIMPPIPGVEQPIIIPTPEITPETTPETKGDEPLAEGEEPLVRPVGKEDDKKTLEALKEMVPLEYHKNLEENPAFRDPVARKLLLGIGGEDEGLVEEIMRASTENMDYARSLDHDALRFISSIAEVDDGLSASTLLDMQKYEPKTIAKMLAMEEDMPTGWVGFMEGINKGDELASSELLEAAMFHDLKSIENLVNPEFVKNYKELRKAKSKTFYASSEIAEDYAEAAAENPERFGNFIDKDLFEIARWMGENEVDASEYFSALSQEPDIATRLKLFYETDFENIKEQVKKEGRKSSQKPRCPTIEMLFSNAPKDTAAISYWFSKENLGNTHELLKAFGDKSTREYLLALDNPELAELIHTKGAVKKVLGLKDGDVAEHVLKAMRNNPGFAGDIISDKNIQYIKRITKKSKAQAREIPGFPGYSDFPHSGYCSALNSNPEIAVNPEFQKRFEGMAKKDPRSAYAYAGYVTNQEQAKLWVMHTLHDLPKKDLVVLRNTLEKFHDYEVQYHSAMLGVSAQPDKESAEKLATFLKKAEPLKEEYQTDLEEMNPTRYKPRDFKNPELYKAHMETIHGELSKRHTPKVTVRRL